MAVSFQLTQRHITPRSVPRRTPQRCEKDAPGRHAREAGDAPPRRADDGRAPNHHDLGKKPQHRDKSHAVASIKIACQ